MTVLTANELADMRLVSDDFFPDTCTIQTKTAAVDALGGLNPTYANTYTSVKCRVDPVGMQDELIANLRIEAEQVFWLNIPYDQAITVEDRVIHNSTTYEVRYVWLNQSYATIRRAIITKVD